MSLQHLYLGDFRSFEAARFEPDPRGTTVLTGPNGAGKTTVLEAVAYLGTQRSFRGAPREAMVRSGCTQAIIRAELTQGGLPLLVEAELALEGRSRLQVNRQSVQSRRHLAEAVPVTIFCPEDLSLVQGPPARRRELLDDALRLLDPRAAVMADEFERIIRQRRALLRQSSGRLTAEIETTLEVWDERLASAGTALMQARVTLTQSLRPYVDDSYAALAGVGEEAAREHPVVDMVYRPSWEGELGAALLATRNADLRRATTTVGPHRDDLGLQIATRDARLQASQGEQRCLALALRLGVHRLVTERWRSPPILLLDDVFSELDPTRSRALVGQLPEGQALLTTAVPLPVGVAVASVIDVRTLGTETARPELGSSAQ